MVELPLAGVVVAEVGQRIAAGVCGALLAQLGATVICLEAQDGPKYAQRTQLTPGKLSVLRDAACNLSAADVLIVSSDVDESEPLAGPTAIVCDITALGPGEAALTDLEVQALSGMMALTGLPDGLPVAVDLPVVECLTGIHAAIASLAALRARRLGGGGQRVEATLYDAAFGALSSFLTRLLDGGAAGEPRRMGNRHTLSAPWNHYAALDGRLLLCTGSDDQWRRLCDVISRPELSQDPSFATSAARVANCSAVDEAVGAWAAKRSVAECVATFSAARIPCGPIVTIGNAPDEANLRHRGMIRQARLPDGGSVFLPASPFAMSLTPGRSPDSVPAPGSGAAQAQAALSRPSAAPCADSTRLPLEGVRVIEIGHYTTAPVSARFLGALGADVVKVEPPAGEAARAWPPFLRGESLFYVVNNTDKRCISLDLDSPADAAQLRALLVVADVLIENLKPGALGRKGFSPEQIAALSPGLVYCGISGFGARSLYAGRPAFDTVVQAMSGLMDTVRAGDTPVKTGISLADIMSAALATVAVLAALEVRDRTGRGQFIDLSMQDVMAWSTFAVWNTALEHRRRAAVFACADGVVAADAPAGSTDARCDEVVADCHARGLGAARVRSLSEMFAAPETSRRALRQSVADKRGEWPALRVPFTLSATPPCIRRPAPALGQHAAEVLEQWIPPTSQWRNSA